ncbi:MAG: DUF2341 domain-containing protein [Chitinispirillaceae bacterium]|nr:DUF2341 domain-containing protein [Chitinispirillaceae bacterium]
MIRATVGRILGTGTGWAGCVGLLLLCVCSPSPLSTDGGGTRGGNPVVTGTIIGIDGAEARNVRVSLIEADYDPVADASLPLSSTDTTDSHGSFSIKAPDSGLYNIEAVGILDGARSLRFNVRAIRDSVLVVPADTLHSPGTIRMPVPEGGDSTGGYVYVPGTHITTPISDPADTVTLDSVPAGVLPVLYNAGIGSAFRRVIRYDISVSADSATIIGNPQWSRCRSIGLNTTASGAGVTGDVYGFPALIRLDGAALDFAQALPDGSDLMFTGSGDTPLPCEIERWDAAAKRADVWVGVDTIRGNDSVQSITMYWGNPAPPPPENGAVFDTACGFQGVWHLGDAADDTVGDATVNHYHGISPDSARPPVAQGIIGNCRNFDGTGDYITMPNTASGRLDFPQNGSYTLSAWVTADTLIDLPQTVASKGMYEYFIWLNGATWQFSEYQDASGWNMTPQKAAVGQWVLLTGVRDGSAQYLYVNGVPADTILHRSSDEPRNAASDFIIGRAHDASDRESACFFAGGIDEVRVCSVVHGSDWIKLCYMNQRTDDRLVVFR